jgi:phytanoyl-CoA hydroxylase
MDMHTLREDYRTNGFVVLRGALSAREAAAYRTAAEDLIGCERAADTANDGYRAVILQAHQAGEQDERLRGLARHPRLAAMAAWLTSVDRLRVFLDQVIAKEPGGRETIAHQDAPFLSFSDARSVNCWVALSSVTVANGALRYFAGSHLAGNLGLVHLDGHENIAERSDLLRECATLSVELAPGDAAFHNCLCVHGAHPNTTTEPRLGFSIQYMPDGATYNGWHHVFLDSHRPMVGEPLSQSCFPLVHVDGTGRSDLSTDGE